MDNNSTISFGTNAGFGKKPKPILFNNINYSIEGICDKINHVDELDVDEIKSIILRQYPTILDYDLFLKSNKTRKLALELFTNKNFLSILDQVAGLLKLSPDQITCINKLTYDYYTLGNNNKDIADLFLSISYKVNKSLSMRLSTIIGINGGRILSMISRSSFRLEKNVHRVNTFLLRCGLNLSVNDIVEIYRILYSESITYPFIYTMLETKDNIETENQELIFDRISLAWISILNTMSFSDICYIFNQYGASISLTGINDENIENKVRFKLKSVQYNKKIQNAIIEIEQNENYNYKVP